MGGGAVSGSGAATLPVPARHRRPSCRSPQHRLESCAPGAAASRAPRLTRPRGGCQTAVGQRGTPETHGEARREAERRTPRERRRLWKRIQRDRREGDRGAADTDLAATGGVRLARTHARVHRPPPATHGHTRPAPPLRRFPPTKPSYNRLGGSQSASARLARTGGSWSCDQLLESPHREPSPPSRYGAQP